MAASQLEIARNHEGNHSNIFSRFLSEVIPVSYLGQAEGLAVNSKPIYEVCDSKSKKFA